MYNFNKLYNATKLISTSTLVEHCKTDEYFLPFNMLQYDILKYVYEKYLENTPGFEDVEINGRSDIIMMYATKIPNTLKLLGDDLCREISNEETVAHTYNDIKRWGDTLFQMMQNIINEKE